MAVLHPLHAPLYPTKLQEYRQTTISYKITRASSEHYNPTTLQMHRQTTMPYKITSASSNLIQSACIALKVKVRGPSK